MGDTKDLLLCFGALAPMIATQLRDAEVGFDAQDIDQLQRDADAITRLSVRHYLTEAATNRARRRLTKAVKHAVSRG